MASATCCMDAECLGKSIGGSGTRLAEYQEGSSKDYQICSLLCWIVAWIGSHCPACNAGGSFPMVEILFLCRSCESDPDFLARAQANGRKDGAGICCNGTDPGTDFYPVVAKDCGCLLG